MSDQLFSLSQVAEQVRVRPATIAYWVRTFPTALSDHATERRPPAFTSADVALLHRIRDLALDAGYSVQQIRRSLSTSSGPREVLLTERVEQLLHEVQSLREEITFLAEESKELHRMLALLMQFAWQTDKQTAAGSLNEKKSPLHPNAPHKSTNGRAGSHMTESVDHPGHQEPTHPWTPPTLG